ncbi:MAG: helix-hairpin-helix domain-containing protein [Rubricoccaceae bacterium]|nr:helix-hairpin-helix domain-containing protein [Rubricoccaceae bacterium]
MTTHQIGPTNEELAGVLEEMAALLTKMNEPNPYRVQAYLQAAAMLREHEVPAALLYAEGGRKALMELPGVGVSLALHLAQYIEDGRAGLHDRLRAAADPIGLLASVPGIGEALARRIVDELEVTTLTELEKAVQDGRLAALDGFGPRRLEGLRLQLGAILHRATRRRARRVRRDLLRLAAARARAEQAAEARDADEALAHEEAAGAVPEAAPTARILPLFPPAAA